MKWAFFCDFESDGFFENLPDGVKISDATYVVAYKSIATSYNHFSPEKAVENFVSKAKSIGYEKLFSDHIKEFSSIMNRSSLCLESDENLKNLDTDERLKRIKEGNEDIGFSELYFNYGK